MKSKLEIVSLIEQFEQGKISRNKLIRELLEMSPERTRIVSHLDSYLLQIVVHAILIEECPKSDSINKWNGEIKTLIRMIRDYNRKVGVPKKEVYDKKNLWILKEKFDSIFTDTLDSEAAIDLELQHHKPIIQRSKTIGWDKPSDFEKYVSFDTIYPEFRRKD